MFQSDLTGGQGGGGAGFDGAIFQYAGILNLSNAQFLNNSAEGGSPGGQGKGGALFILKSATANLSGVTFTGSRPLCHRPARPERSCALFGLPTASLLS